MWCLQKYDTLPALQVTPSNLSTCKLIFSPNWKSLLGENPLSCQDLKMQPKSGFNIKHAQYSSICTTQLTSSCASCARWFDQGMRRASCAFPPAKFTHEVSRTCHQELAMGFLWTYYYNLYISLHTYNRNFPWNLARTSLVLAELNWVNFELNELNVLTHDLLGGALNAPTFSAVLKLRFGAAVPRQTG